MKKWLWVLWWIPPLIALPISIAVAQLPTGDARAPRYREPGFWVVLALLYVVVAITVRATLGLKGPSKPQQVRGFPVLPPKTDETDDG
jgi:hypothetical protein